MKNSVVVEPGQDARLALEQWFLERAVPEIGRQLRLRQLNKEQVVAFIEHRNPFEVAGWILKRTQELRDRLQNFFGKDYDLTLFQEVLKKYGKEKIESWESMGLQVGFLPKEKMGEENNFPQWKIKPEEWFYKQFKEGNIFRKNVKGELVKDSLADELEGIVVLFESRCKPSYKEGTQMWEEDESFFGPLINRLREDGKIQKYDYGSQSSRFGTSADEWERHLQDEVAQLLGITREQVRLERAIEFNVLSQLYSDLPRSRDGITDTWLWFEEYFEGASGRLRGGYSCYGGLAHVRWHGSAHHWSYISFRPLAVLASWNVGT